MSDRDPKATELLELALDDVAGAALILDEGLHIVAATAAAESLMGAPVPLGELAAKLLCGQGPQRPIAEAMAEGRAITAEVPRATADGGTRVLHVRASPIVRDGGRQGWILLMQGESWQSEGPDAPVEVFGMHTRDAAMKKLFRDIERVGRRDATVLVRGETGTGKELVARAIHTSSSRASGPFRAINCAALPPNLLESVLFGHVRGAFTGAVRDSPGHFRLSHGGTLFLDEIAELSLPLQAKLLRVLQERTVIPVGGSEPVPIDVRIVSATHRSLRAAVAGGSFRADLMYRIRVVPLFLPPLREREGDVGLLAWHLVNEENRAQAEDRQVRQIAPGAIALLEAYDWPGNVRELQNVVEYAFAMGEGPVITEADLPPELRGAEPREPTVNIPAGAGASADEDPEAERIRYALERASGHRGRAAATLGMSRATLWRKMRQHGLLDDPTGS